MVSHELRTPLTSITGALDLVLSGLAGELEREAGALPQDGARVDREAERHRRRAARPRAAREGQARMATEVDEPRRARPRDASSATSPPRRSAARRSRVETPPAPARLVADPRPPRPGALEPAHERGQVRARERRHPRPAVPLAGACPGMLGLSVWNAGEALPEADLERISRSSSRRGATATGACAAPASGSPSAAASSRRTAARSGRRAPATACASSWCSRRSRRRGPSSATRSGPTRRRCSWWTSRTRPRSSAACSRARGHPLRPRRAIRRGALAGPPAPAAPRRVRTRASPRSTGVPLAEILRHDAETRAGRAPRLLRPVRARRRSARGADGVPAEAGAARRRSPPRRSRCSARGRPARRPGARRRRRPRHPRDLRRGAREPGLRGPRGGHLRRRPPARCWRSGRSSSSWTCSSRTANGFSLLEGLAEERASEPFAVVFLSARGETADKVRALRLGADDYLTKPFDAQELVARIDAVLRRREAALQASPMTRLPGGRAIEQRGGAAARGADPVRALLRRPRQPEGLQRHVRLREGGRGHHPDRGDPAPRGGRHGGEAAFLGHIGGDDFVVLSAPERAQAVCREIITDVRPGHPALLRPRGSRARLHRGGRSLRHAGASSRSCPCPSRPSSRRPAGTARTRISPARRPS